MKIRLKRVVVNPSMLISIMKNDTGWRVAEGIPRSAILKGCALDPYSMTINLFIEDASFEPIEEGEVAPILKTSFYKVI